MKSAAIQQYASEKGKEVCVRARLGQLRENLLEHGSISDELVMFGESLHKHESRKAEQNLKQVQYLRKALNSKTAFVKNVLDDESKSMLMEADLSMNSMDNVIVVDLNAVEQVHNIGGAVSDAQGCKRCKSRKRMLRRERTHRTSRHAVVKIEYRL